ncbi:hypothetical protein C8Q80DRAFT_1150119 [Daedaleopsis nitida]|nr:hypothetical protein C8Q80DRAFT_1150119 [Daedaleopsis nitida]
MDTAATTSGTMPPESPPPAAAPLTSPQVEAEAEASPSSESPPVRGPLDMFARVSFVRRWLFTTALLALLMYRILSAQGWYIVPYVLSLSLMAHNKKYRKAVEEAARAQEDLASDQMEKGIAPATVPAAQVDAEKDAASLEKDAASFQPDSKPLFEEKDMQQTADKDVKMDTEAKADAETAAPAEPQDLAAIEFGTWKSSTYATLVAFPCAYIGLFNFPIYWPVLAGYVGGLFLFDLVWPAIKRVYARYCGQTDPNISI